MKRVMRAADLFCGAGGFTSGAEAAGVRVVLAVNHWRTAIYTHQHNHPETRHICARVEHIDARNDATLPAIDLLMASPECTHHSNARGGRPVSDQKRQQPFALLDWIDARRPKWVLVENVREFRDWGPLRNMGTERNPAWRPDPDRKGETFNAWLAAIAACGYQVDHALLNAADFGAPTKRIRLFVIARRGHSRRDIPWPEPTHAGRWRAAAEIIDWARPCPSIFTRKRPLADKTLRRIEIGLKKFVGPFQFKAMGRNPGVSKGLDEPLPTIVAARENHAVVMPFLSQFHNGPDGANRNYDPAGPLPTIDTQNRYGLAMPFLYSTGGRNNGECRPAGEPLNTIVTREHQALAVPFLVPHFGEREGQGPRTHAIDEPTPTVTGQGAGSLAVPYLLDTNHGENREGRNRIFDLANPLGTVTAANGKALCLPFLTKYYGTGGAAPINEPLDTVTANDRFGLAMVSLVETMRELGVIDIGFRMLEPDELAAAQGFPAGYYLHGTRAEQVRQVGNAVCPPVAEALCRTIYEAA